MTTFHYEAINHNRQMCQSSIEAANRHEAIAKLKASGLTPTVVSVSPLGIATRQNRRLFQRQGTVNPLPISDKQNTTRGSILSKGMNRATVSRFYAMLANQLEVGVPIMQAIQVIGETEQYTEPKRILTDLNARIGSGQSLSRALSAHCRYFSTIETQIIRAGEEGGFITSALSRIVSLREWQSSLHASMWAALAYPLILVCVAAMLLPAVMILIVPRFEPLYESLRQQGNMPWLTSMLLLISDFLEQYGLVMLAVIGGAIVFIYKLPGSVKLRWLERSVQPLPAIGELYQDWTLSQLTQVLSMLIQNQVPILTALEVASKATPSFKLQHAIEQACQEIGKGKSLVQPLAKSGLVRRELLAMIHVAEQSNTMAQVLGKIATQLECQLRRRLEIVVKLIEPLLLMMMAIVVGFIVIALLLPLFESHSFG